MMKEFVVSLLLGLVPGLALLLLWFWRGRAKVKQTQEKKDVVPDPSPLTTPPVSMLQISPEEYVKVVKDMLQRGCRACPDPLPAIFATECGMTYDMIPPRVRPVLHALLVLELGSRMSNPGRGAFTPVILQSAAIAATMAALVYEDEMVFPAPPLERKE